MARCKALLVCRCASRFCASCWTRDFQAGMEDLKQLQTLAIAQIRDLRVSCTACGQWMSMAPICGDGAAHAEGFQRRAAYRAHSSAPTLLWLPQEMTRMFCKCCVKR